MNKVSDGVEEFARVSDLFVSVEYHCPACILALRNMAESRGLAESRRLRSGLMSKTKRGRTPPRPRPHVVPPHVKVWNTAGNVTSDVAVNSDVARPPILVVPPRIRLPFKGPPSTCPPIKGPPARTEMMPLKGIDLPFKKPPSFAEPLPLKAPPAKVYPSSAYAYLTDDDTEEDNDTMWEVPSCGTIMRGRPSFLDPYEVGVAPPSTVLMTSSTSAPAFSLAATANEDNATAEIDGSSGESSTEYNHSRERPRIGSAIKRRARRTWLELANPRPTGVVLGCRARQALPTSVVICCQVPQDFRALRG